jgi:demethylmenaquinone methyltransferase/2-methoxy-6-polyprenyl-1,4-benzoquinol methylase
MSEKKVDFGYREVEATQKDRLVQEVFHSVASRYDLMNDLMSFGLHHLWKEKLINELRPTADQLLVDVAGGTGDIAHRFIQKGGGKAIVIDANPMMMQYGQDKLIDKGAIIPQIDWQIGNAEDLPLPDNFCDAYSISFGIRNVTNKEKALAEAYRVLKPMGKFVCLELSNIDQSLLSKIYDFYSFKVIPKVGKLVTGDEDAYQYLVESIRRFPSAENFAHMIEESGFEGVKYRKFSFGVVTLHSGIKLGRSN